MGSTRLPGKVVAELAGEPLLALMVRRLRHGGFDVVVVATSDHERDDVVAETARAAGAGVVRGSEHDVLDRVATAAATVGGEAVVRLTADCPLVDPAVVRDAVDLHRRTGADYTSNTLVRCFPDGLDVEVVSAAALTEARRRAVDPSEREHVTPYVYRRPDRFRLAALTAPERLGHRRWTVDTAADLRRVRRLVGLVGDPVTASWRQFAAVENPAAAPPALRPLLPGMWPAAGAGHRPLADPAHSRPDPASWWGRSLKEATPWVSRPPSPFFWAWEVGDGAGWVGVTFTAAGEERWGSVDPIWLRRATAGLRRAAQTLAHARPAPSGRAEGDS